MIAGMFDTYKEYLESRLWKEKRDFLINEIGECQICHSQYNLLVHHLNYDSVGNESILDVQVLCWFCHNKIHGEKDG